MDLSYSKKVLQHFRNPKNMGEIPDADGVATVGNPVCGDVMKMYIKISDKKIGDKKEKIIKDIKFQTLGCGAAIATSSITTQLVKGKTIAEAEKLTNEMVAKELGGLPPVKMHCSLLAVEALHKALADYQKKTS